MAEGRPRRGPRLENRLPAEGINSSDQHPRREFAWLVGGAIAALLVLMALLAWGARWLAPHVPFAADMALAERLGVARPKPEHAMLRTHPLTETRQEAVRASAVRAGAALAGPMTPMPAPLVRP